MSGTRVLVRGTLHRGCVLQQVGHFSKGQDDPDQESKISPTSSYYNHNVFLHSGYKNTRRKVGHFSKGEHVVVRIGGREIAEFRSNPGQDSKISPRSGHPSPQKCCIHSFTQRFVKFLKYMAQSRRLFQGRTRRGADRWA